MRRMIGGFVAVTALLGLAACESSAPATRTGMALDHAGTVTGTAVGNAGAATGNAVSNAGSYVKQKVDPNATTAN